MNSITIRITPRSEEQELLELLDAKVRKLGQLSASDRLVVAEAKNVARDFIARAHRPYGPGTTLQVSKDLQLSGAKLSLRLDCPGTESLMSRLLGLIRGT